MVDNGSQDDSVSRVTLEFPWVKLIANEHNLGFARTNNQALKMSTGEYVYFLNPDGSAQSSVEGRYPGLRRAKMDLRGLTEDIVWVLGASMIARRAIVEDVGGFDEDFFLYGEE